jgi:hypothetical protein
MRRWWLVVVIAVACHGASQHPVDATSDASASCAGGTADCDGIADNGCETDVTTVAHCGAETSGRDDVDI